MVPIYHSNHCYMMWITHRLFQSCWRVKAPKFLRCSDMLKHVIKYTYVISLLKVLAKQICSFQGATEQFHIEYFNINFYIISFIFHCGSLSEPHHVRSAVKSVYLLAWLIPCLLDTQWRIQEFWKRFHWGQIQSGGIASGCWSFSF